MQKGPHLFQPCVNVEVHDHRRLFTRVRLHLKLPHDLKVEALVHDFKILFSLGSDKVTLKNTNFIAKRQVFIAPVFRKHIIF
jgi:hypothetical protein